MPFHEYCLILWHSVHSCSGRWVGSALNEMLMVNSTLTKLKLSRKLPLPCFLSAGSLDFALGSSLACVALTTELACLAVSAILNFDFLFALDKNSTLTSLSVTEEWDGKHPVEDLKVREWTRILELNTTLVYLQLPYWVRNSKCVNLSQTHMSLAVYDRISVLRCMCRLAVCR